MLRHVALVRSDVSDERIPSKARVMMEALHYSETSVLTRATWRKIPEDGILHSHRREKIKSHIELTGWVL
jgi:hypothetical protein